MTKTTDPHRANWTQHPGVDPAYVPDPAANLVPFGHDDGYWMVQTLDFSEPNIDGDYGPCGHPDRLPQVKDLRGTVMVRVPRVWPAETHDITFPKLSPFAQAYTDALMDDLLYFQESARHVEFGQFNPHTLLRLMTDCAVAEQLYLDHGIEPCGLTFWVDRLNGQLPDCDHFAVFRPLTPMLTSGVRGVMSKRPRIIFALPLGENPDARH